MHFDFAAFLVLATFITGVIWGLDAIIWAPRRRELAEGEETAHEPVIVEYARSFFPIILIVLVLRSFLVEPFRIPSGSMMPTLLDGDFILVNKYDYGIRLPVLAKKIINIGTPKRGDVIVFRYPREPSIDYIKRVVGEPGDHITYRNKILYINGKKAEQTEIGIYNVEGAGKTMNGASERQERLDGVEHHLLINGRRGDQGFEYTVPDDEYFVMGDNRDNSNDSRYWGTVPDANLIGRAFMIWMNWDSVKSSVSWNRLGTFIE